MERAFAVGHQIAVAAFHHDDECGGRQMHVLQRVAVGEHAVRHDVLAEFRTQFLGDFHPKAVAVRRQGSGKSEAVGGLHPNIYLVYLLARSSGYGE